MVIIGNFKVSKGYKIWKKAFLENEKMRKEHGIKVLAYGQNEMNSDQSDLVRSFNEGLELYFKQEWKNALKKFKEASELEEDFLYRPTTPSNIYIERCEAFIKKPPPKDWNGVWAMNTK